MAEGAGAIDSLIIEIGASSANAVQQINNLANALKGLKDAANGNILNLGAFKAELDKIGDSEISKIEKLGNALRGLKGVRLDSKIGDAMTNIAAACDLIEQRHIAKLEKFGQAMQYMRGVQTAGYDKLPTSLTNIATAVDSITDDTIARIHRLTLALSRLRGVDLSGLAAVLNAQRRNALGGNGNNGGGRGGSGGAGGSGGPSPGGGSAGGQSGSGGAGGGQAGGSNGQGGPQWTWSLKQNLKIIGDQWRNIGSKISTNVNPNVKLFASILAGAAKTAAKLAKSIMSFAGKTLKTVWDKSAFAGLERSLKRIQNVISSFKRVAFYRAIRSAIKYVTDALKEGTDNAYHYAREYGDTTSYIADAFDNLASAEFKMSNQLGAAWATMIAYIEPILIRLINIVTKAADAVTQFFAILSGKKTYLKAADYNKKWAESATGAAKAAKEWKNQLLGFDEINRLEEPSDSSGGGGSGSGLDYGGMFEESAKNEFFEEIRDAFENGEWARLGKLLGDKFNEIVNSIDWKGFGQKMGKRLQAEVEVAYNFLKTADFKNLGQKLSDYVNAAMSEIDFSELGRLWMRLRTALWDVIYGAVVNLDWAEVAQSLSDFILGALDELSDWLDTLEPEKIAKSLKDFFGNIKYQEIADALKEVGKKALGLFADTVGGLLPEDTGDNVRDGIVEAIRNADFAAIHNVLQYKLDKALFGEDWADFFWKFGDYAGKDIVLGMMDGVDEQGRSSKYKNRVSEFIVGVLGLPSDDQWKQWGKTAIGWLGDGFADIKTDLDTIVAEPVRKFVDEDLPETVEFFKNLGPKAYAWLSEGFADIKTELDTVVAEPIRKFVDEDIPETVEFFKGLGPKAYTWLSEGFADIKGELDTIIKDPFDKLVNEDIPATVEFFKDLGPKAVAWLSEGLKDFGTELHTIFVKPFEDMWDGLKTWWDDLSLAPFRIPKPDIVWSSKPVDGGLARVLKFFGLPEQIPTLSINWYANGGFPEDGLFMANHGELVGKFSNGRTAVANNEQIIAGVSAGVFDAVVSAFAQTGGNGSGNDRPVNIYLDGRLIAQSTTKYQSQYAKAMGA